MIRMCSQITCHSKSQMTIMMTCEGYFSPVTHVTRRHQLLPCLSTWQWEAKEKMKRDVLLLVVTGVLGGGSQRPSPPHSTKFCRSTKSKQTGVQTQLAKPETSDSPSSAISFEDSCAPPRTACPQKNAS